jgi:arylsulfatase A-like enzyme/ribosomal protein L7/L12
VKAPRLLLLLALAAACNHAPPPDTRPDLVLVVIDTLRADHLSTWGYDRPTSPGIDALGASGAVFLDDTSQSSWTLPSVASIQIGRHLFVNAQRLPDGVPSLAERLEAAGYETLAFLGNPAISPAGGYDRGYSAFVGRETTGNVTWDAPELHAALKDWMAQHPRGDKPRFFYLHFMDPHYPYEPKSLDSLPGTARIPDDTIKVWTQKALLAGAGTPLHDSFDTDRKYILSEIDAYDREIAIADRELGSILTELRAASGAAGHELFVVLGADHGEMLWDHEHHPKKIAEYPPEQRTLRNVFFRDHSYHMFQQLVHVPLIAAGPGIAAGQRIETPVENVDIVPTLLRAAGVADDPELEGRALQDVLAGKARPRTTLYSYANEATLVRQADSGFKLIFPTRTGDDLGMPIQLYNLKSDPRERDNLYGSADPHIKELTGKLLGLREQAEKSFHLYDQQKAVPVNPAQDKLLKELGYTGPGFGGGGTAGAVETPTSLDVVLVGAGSDRSALLKLLAGLDGATKESAAALLQSLPQTVGHALPPDKANALKLKLTAAGGTVRLEAPR